MPAYIYYLSLGRFRHKMWLELRLRRSDCVQSDTLTQCQSYTMSSLSPITIIIIISYRLYHHHLHHHHHTPIDGLPYQKYPLIPYIPSFIGL